MKITKKQPLRPRGRSDEKRQSTAVCTSQVISNVPAAVVLSGFTDQWRYMLAGVNIGGLGTPIASLASLITMKFYANWKDTKISKFIGYFLAANVIGLAILLLFVQIVKF